MEAFKTIENEEIEEVEVMEEEYVLEEGLGSKIKAGFKKHGKKIVAGAALLTCGIIGYVLGKKSNEEYDYDSDDTDDELFLLEDVSEEVEPNNE